MSTLVTIQSTDLITNSRADLNGNFNALNNDKMETSVLDTDSTLSANSDAKIPSQKAVKAYVDAGGNPDIAAAQAGGGDFGTPSATNKFVTEDKLSAEIKETQQIIYNVADSPATWTKDAGLKRIFVQMWGGGGSGSIGTRTDSERLGGAGGGGGGYFEAWLEASELGDTETITIGAGGASVTAVGTISNASGNGGGNTTFGSLLTAYGGGAGEYLNGGNGASSVAAAAGSGDGGAGGVDTAGAGGNGFGYGGGGGGAFNGNGSGSDSGGSAGGKAAYGGGGGGGVATTAGAGGTSIRGGSGGAGVTSAGGTAVGVAGSVPAGGGGGASSYSGGSVTSGAGGAGRCIVTEYYV